MNKLTVFYDHVRNACKQTGLTLEEVAEKIVTAGVTGSEIEYIELVGEEGKRLADKLASLGMPVSSVYCHFRWELEEPAQNYIEVLSRLQSLGIHYLLAIPGFKLPGQDSLASRQMLLPHLQKLCEVAGDYGVQVLMEDFDDEPVSFGTSDEVKWYMDNVPELGCAFDTGNFYYFDDDVLEAYDKLKDKIVYVHCKDRSITPVDGADFKPTISGISMYASAVGSGVIPMTEVLSKILDAGYEGPLAIEHFGSLKQLDDILASTKYLKSLIR